MFSIIIGSKAYEYKTFKKDKFPFDVFINRIKKNIIPVAHFGLFASPEGFFYKGLGEVFANVVYSMTELNSAVLNTAIDNSNAPAILNIENSDGGDTMQQIKLAKQRKENTGDNTYIIPTAVTDEEGLAGLGVSASLQFGAADYDHVAGAANCVERRASSAAKCRQRAGFHPVDFRGPDGNHGFTLRCGCRPLLDNGL